MENTLQGSRQESFYFTTNWFDKNIPNWNKFLAPLKKKKIEFLGADSVSENNKNLRMSL